MSSEKWIPITRYDMPPEGVAVMTKVYDGKGVRNEEMLIRKGNLYFFTDMSMYVYYTPTHYMIK